MEIALLTQEGVASAQVDPGSRYPLDINFANNSFRRQPDAAFATRGEASFVRLVSRWLHGISVFN